MLPYKMYVEGAMSGITSQYAERPNVPKIVLQHVVLFRVAHALYVLNSI